MAGKYHYISALAEMTAADIVKTKMNGPDF